MRNLKLLLLLFITGFAFANDPYVWDWSKKSEIADPLEINSIKYTNRAQCAIDSQIPTKSVILMIDSVNPGKSFYRLAKRLGENSDDVTKLGIEKFRYSVTKLSNYIMRRILTGELPLLKTNLDKNKNSAYVSAVKECKNYNSCSNLHSFISRVWNSKSSYTLRSELGFSRNDFIKQKSAKLGCYYIKKFSAIQGHFQMSLPNAEAAQNLAETLDKTSEYLVSCDNLAEQQNLKVANYQLDITGINDSEWNKIGFDFWNSVKIYLSWAQKYSQEIDSLSQPFQRLIKSIAFEEVVLLLPNGCKSINEPKCDAASLNLNSMRTFSQVNKEEDLMKTDFMSQFADGVELDVLQRPIVDVNEDILKFNTYENANKWAMNFSENYRKARGFFKLKFMGAINKIKLIKANLNHKNFDYELDKSANSNLDVIKDELYYLCSEYKIATDEKFSFLNEDLKLLDNASILDSLSAKVGGENIKSYFTYFSKLKENVLRKCNDLQKNGYWKDGHEIDREGFSAWYQEHTQNKNLPFKNNINRKISKEVTPILSLAKDAKFSRTKEIICVDGANCARHVLDSIIDLYSSLKYADSMLVDNDIKAPNMGNPYSERLSCDVYDPWLKKRATIKQFFYDIARAAFFGFLPTPVYVSTEVTDKRVVSLRSLLDDGKIVFDPKYDPGEMKHAFMADFGPLMGVPCAVSISNNDFNPIQYYRFNGVSVGTCKENRNFETVANSSTEITDSNSTRSKCFTCAINLETVASAASSIEPITRSAFILIRGVYNFYKGMKDPHNIPRSWELNPNDVYDVYRRWGIVNNHCLKKLLKGEECMTNSCENSLVRNAKKLFKGNITGSYATRFRGDAYIKTTECSSPITMKMDWNRRTMCNSSYEATIADYNIPYECSNILKKDSIMTSQLLEVEND